MSVPLPQVDFRQIRHHDSSQQRAWEELAFVLVPDIEGLPHTTTVERRAAPDGGIEFSCMAPVGLGSGRWAWQAKFLFRLDTSAFAQMEKSVVSALTSTPDLERYTFVLPVDRGAGRSAQGTRTFTRWNEKVAAWKALAARNGANVHFDFIGHSAVLKALQDQKHAGLLRYFFDATFLTDRFFKHQVSRELKNLGERYDPAVHVDLEIADVLEGACRSPEFVQSVTNLLDELESCAPDSLATKDMDSSLQLLIGEAEGSVRELIAYARATVRRLGTPDRAVLLELAAKARVATERFAKIDSRVQQLLSDPREVEPPITGIRPKRRKRSDPSTDGARGFSGSRRHSLYQFTDRTWRLSRALQAVRGAFDSDSLIAAQRAAVLLQGPAGCGKSHLVADFAKKRVEAGLPTLLVLGQHLTEGQLWPQIASSVGLDLAAEELLQALEVAAYLRGAGRALIIVDAINEGAGADLWPHTLAGFLSDIAAHPWIAVTLTLRSTYSSAILPASSQPDALVRVSHPGLAGHEEEALTRYAAHYGLRLPDIPPLLPELLNPLFLRSLCQSAMARGLSAIPREATSIEWVFAGVIEAVNQRLCHPQRLDVDPADGLVKCALEALAEAMLESDTEALPLQTAKEICARIHPATSYSKSLFEGLIAEGLLIRERISSGTGPPGPLVEQVRFTYQRFADHVGARALVAKHVQNGALAEAITEIAMGPRVWARMGLLESLALVVPEQRHIELADLLRLPPKPRPRLRTGVRKLSPAAGRRAWLRERLAHSLINTLAWRDPQSITSTTRKLVRAALRTGAVTDDEWLNLLLSLACVPGHPFNVQVIDRALRGMSMPDRDGIWSDQVLSIWAEDTNPIQRTIEWAWSVKERPPIEVAELAAILLAWLLTSPNRRLRDTATKALVRLADNQTDLIASLLGQFKDVDDPYVHERLLAVACGHAIRHRYPDSSRCDLDAFERLAQAAFNIAFAGTPVAEHLLVRHYARTCIEEVNHKLRTNGRALTVDLGRCQPPYDSSWPLAALSLRELAKAYGKPRSRYIWAVTEMGDDFEKYVIDRGIADDFVMPQQEKLQRARRAAATRRRNLLCDAIVNSAHPKRRSFLRKAIADLLAFDDPSILVEYAWATVRRSAPRAAAEVERLKHLARSRGFLEAQFVQPSSRLLARWISQRVLDLGWTPERFGERDNRLRGARDRGWPESERYGKKYLWIGFHQLLGHLTDHCLLKEAAHDSPLSPYSDPWQISHAVDIDPTILLRGDEPRNTKAAARVRAPYRTQHGLWWLDGYRHSLKAAGSDREWLIDVRDIPRPEPLLVARDPMGREWLVLESHARWRAHTGGASEYERRDLWMMTQAYVFPIEEQPALAKWAAERNWMGRWMPMPSNNMHGFLRGYPDLPPWRRMIAADDEDRFLLAGSGAARLSPGWVNAADRARLGEEAKSFPLALATRGCLLDSGRDFSAVQLPNPILPAPLLIDLLKAQWAGPGARLAHELDLGAAEKEFAWVASGEVVAFASVAQHGDGTTLFCVRSEPVLRALEAARLGLWSWVLGEKNYWTSPHNVANERVETFAAVALAPSVSLWGRTIEHVTWGTNHSEIRARLSAERPRRAAKSN